MFNEDFNRRFYRKQRFASWLVLIVSVLIFCYFLVIGFFTFKIVNSVSMDGGIKPIIERIWCGNPGCIN